MTRNVKVLALALFVVAAMSMMAAVAAQGSELHVETPTRAIITGEQTTQHVFQITANNAGPKVRCTQAHIEGTVEGGHPQITVQEVTTTATYTGCQFLGLAAQITMNGCKYTLTNKLGQVTNALTATVDITGCTTNADGQHKPIEVHVPGCTLTIPQQHNLSHVVFTNVLGPPKHVTAHVTISGITYETHGAACAHQPETVLRHDGTFHGTTTLKAFEDLGTQQVTHNGHQYQKGITGAQVGLVAT